ncbi:MAG: trypsin-like peptidase domain-containing protein [Myxococcaceae bacterium]
MRPSQAALALLLAAPIALAGPKPTSAALRKAFEANRPTVVQVIGPRRAGAGVMVGAGGQVVTSVDYSGLESAKVRLSADGGELPATVLLADASLGVVVLQLDGPGEFRAAAVKLDATFAKGDWLVGIQRKPDGTLTPLAGQIFSGPSARSRFVETDLPLPAGSPVFDPQGRLVAVTVKLRGRLSSRALPIAAVKLQLAAEAAPRSGP